MDNQDQVNGIEMQDATRTIESKMDDHNATSDVEMHDALTSESRKNVIDVNKLMDLLKTGKKAGDFIAGKQLMLLIGLTGAGKVGSSCLI